MPPSPRRLGPALLLAALSSLRLGAEPAGGPLALRVRPPLPLDAGEGLALRFASGARIELLQDRRGTWATSVPAARREDPFSVVLTPGDAPETGAGGQAVPPRCLGPLAGPAHLFPAAFQGHARPPHLSFRAGWHRDQLLPPPPGSSLPRSARIHLPKAALADPSRRFPVVYVLDGQNAFDASTSYPGVEWALDELAEALEAGTGMAFVLVGIDNGMARRLTEYTFVADPRHGGGEAAGHLAWLVETALPALEAGLPVDPSRRFLVGSSLGGLFGLFTAASRPTAFAGIAAFSPSIWWAGRAILSAPVGEGRKPRLWLDMGTSEGEQPEADLVAMRDRLRATGWGDATLRATLFPKAHHHESAWALRAGAALSWLIGR